MASRTKARWSEAEWFAFGNRVKSVRTEVHSMILDVQHVCRSRELDGLLKVDRQLDKWRSSMEGVAEKDVSREMITRVFYGDPIPSCPSCGQFETMFLPGQFHCGTDGCDRSIAQ
jgi:hypothetical protein